MGVEEIGVQVAQAGALLLNSNPGNVSRRLSGVAHFMDKSTLDDVHRRATAAGHQLEGIHGVTEAIAHSAGSALDILREVSEGTHNTNLATALRETTTFTDRVEDLGGIGTGLVDALSDYFDALGAVDRAAGRIAALAMQGRGAADDATAARTAAREAINAYYTQIKAE